MSQPFRILTVCIGNVCRSPVAERLLRLHLGEAVRAGSLVVESAGVGAMAGHEVHELALAQLTRLGGSGDGFVARQIMKDHVTQADLVLTATVEVRTKTLREEPRAMKRTFTLAEFAAVCEASWDADVPTVQDLVAFAAANRALAADAALDIDDPMGRSEAVHSDVADQIDRHVRRIAGRLGPLLSPPDRL
jgi:protein-tyrosine phosphatase